MFSMPIQIRRRSDMVQNKKTISSIFYEAASIGVILGEYGGTRTPTFWSRGIVSPLLRAVTAVGRLGYYSTSQIL